MTENERVGSDNRKWQQDGFKAYSRDAQDDRLELLCPRA